MQRSWERHCPTGLSNMFSGQRVGLHGGLEDLSKLLELNVLEKWKLGLIFQNRATSAQ